LTDTAVVTLKNRSAIYYYSILVPIWYLAFVIISVVPLKLLGIPLEQPLQESLPVWLGILYLIIAIVGAMVVAILLTNRIAAKFMSKEAMIKIINKNILPYSPFYALIIRNIEKIYQEKDKPKDQQKQ